MQTRSRIALVIGKLPARKVKINSFAGTAMLDLALFGAPSQRVRDGRER
jgi:hypothetical protein